MLPRKVTYATAGVDRELRAKSKETLSVLKKTYRFSRYGEVLELPFGQIFPVGENRYLDFVIEEIGTKVLVAQLAEKYDTIGIDGVAMAVNDVIRSGAKPLAIADNIHVQTSDPTLIAELFKGIVKGATEAECIVSGGEIGDVAEILRGIDERKGFDIIVAALGDVDKEKIIYGKSIKPGDVVIGFRSSGIHSNGVSLARKVLFKKWGGKYEPHKITDGFDRELVYEVLEPTKIYVEPLLKVAEKVKVKAAVHITGDAYLKFDRLRMFSKGIGFEFNNFKPQLIFAFIQKTASGLGGMISDEEMFKTFNMGWGFAIIIDKKDRDKALDALEKIRFEAEQIGQVTGSPGIKVFYRARRILLK